VVLSWLVVCCVDRVFFPLANTGALILELFFGKGVLYVFVVLCDCGTIRCVNVRIIQR
jgi:hypothetical protein